MGGKILDIGEAMIKYNQDYAFITATMFADISFYNWILSNMIQIYYVPKKDSNSYELTYFYLGNEANPINNISLFDHQIIKMDLLKESKLGILEFTKLMLKEDYYITNTLDEFYIESRSSYNQRHFEHGILIYGYDDYQQQVYTAGYDKTGHFSYHTMSYKTYILAFENTRRNSRISCFRRNNTKYEIDKTLIKSLLFEFVNNLNSSDNYRMIQNPLTKCRWGIQAFECIYDTKSYKEICMLYDYIFMMEKRAQLLESSDLAYELRQLLKNVQTVLNLTIKENIKHIHTDNTLKQMDKILRSLKDVVCQLYERI